MTQPDGAPKHQAKVKKEQIEAWAVFMSRELVYVN